MAATSITVPVAGIGAGRRIPRAQTEFCGQGCARRCLVSIRTRSTVPTGVGDITTDPSEDFIFASEPLELIAPAGSGYQWK